jgi:protein-S-isoprenylcysteine O-methyltransferase Ste14
MDKGAFQRRLGIGIVFVVLMQMIGGLTHLSFLYNIALVVYGLSFVFFPVYPADMSKLKNIKLWVRLAGVILVILGLVIRVDLSL